MDYVGSDNNDITFYVQEVCNDTASLRQTWRYEKDRKITETPEDLYQKYLDFSVRLTFNATAWTPQLPPTFISDLDKKLMHRINSADDFCMPNLIPLSKKLKKLKELREIRNTAVRHYMKMEEDIADIKKLLQLQQNFK